MIVVASAEQIHVSRTDNMDVDAAIALCFVIMYVYTAALSTHRRRASEHFMEIVRLSKGGSGEEHREPRGEEPTL
jgi:hypothetical protein